MKDAGDSAHMHHGAATPAAGRSAAQAGRHEASGRAHHDRHEGHRVEDFRRRFWVSLALTVPILALTPLIQGLLGLRESLRFPGRRLPAVRPLHPDLPVRRLALPARASSASCAHGSPA